MSLILDTGKFYYSGILKAWKKAAGFRRGQREPVKFGGVLPSYNSYDPDALRNFLVEAFTVAACDNFDLQERLKQLAEELVKNPNIKNPKEEFVRQAREIIPQYNKTAEQPPPGRVATNYRTAMTSSYHASLWNTMKSAGIYRFIQYKTRDDSRVRDAHRLLHDKIFNVDDPIWSKIYPPNGWNCRCYTRPLTHDEMNQEGLRAESFTQPGSEREKQIVKEADVDKDFMRNAAQFGSIWGKWLNEKISGKDFSIITERIREGVAKDLSPELIKSIPRSNDEKKYDEVWGEVWYEKGEAKTRMNYIRYSGADGFYVNNDNKIIPWDRIDNFRKGVPLWLSTYRK